MDQGGAIKKQQKGPPEPVRIRFFNIVDNNHDSLYSAGSLFLSARMTESMPQNYASLEFTLLYTVADLSGEAT
jgi:hypothetical protein